MQNAIVATQKTCDQMLADTEKQCAKLLHEAEDTVKTKQQNVGALLGEEQSRLAAAQDATAQFIRSIEKRLKRQLELLEELKAQELPQTQELTPKQAFDFEKNPSAPTTQEKADMLIEEIGQRIESTLGDVAAAQPLPQEDEEEPEESEEEEPEEEDDDEPAEEESPVKAAPTHGDLSPAKQKIFEELRFGRAQEKNG